MQENNEICFFSSDFCYEVGVMSVSHPLLKKLKRKSSTPAASG